MYCQEYNTAPQEERPKVGLLLSIGYSMDIQINNIIQGVTDNLVQECPTADS